MHWLNKHARLRNQLSPYLDGALSSTEIATLEAHLGTCEACRAELDELRSTATAVRNLPQVDAPRSFALTPQMLERRVAVPGPSAPPLALGMRLASAGVAVFLAVVVIGDLSDAGGGPDGAREAVDESIAESRTAADLGAVTDSQQADGEAAVPTDSTAEGYDALPPAEDATSAAENDTAACPPGAAAAPTSGGTSAGGAGGPSSGGGGAGAGAPGETAAATPTPQPAATPTPDLKLESGMTCDEQPIAGAAIPATSSPDAIEQQFDADSGVRSPADEDSGLSALRVVEIVLAGSLIALLAGIAVELGLRRRRTA